MSEYKMRSAGGALTLAQAVVTALIGLAGFAVGCSIGIGRLGWVMGLLVGVWPAMLLGAGAAWTVAIGVPELARSVARAASRPTRRTS